MSGKYAISCLGGPEGILGSLAKRTVDCVKALLAEAEAICLEEYLKMVRGIAVLIIVSKTINELKLLTMMKSIPRYDVYDRIHSSALVTRAFIYINITFITQQIPCSVDFPEACS